MRRTDATRTRLGRIHQTATFTRYADPPVRDAPPPSPCGLAARRDRPAHQTQRISCCGQPSAAACNQAALCPQKTHMMEAWAALVLSAQERGEWTSEANVVTLTRHQAD